MMQRPFLKWAGGKAKQAERIAALLPSAKTLVEPFVGAGAIFLNTEYDHYVLSDINPDLINTFVQLQADPAGFIDATAGYFTPEHNNADKFLELRAVFNTTDNLFLKAVLFVYLNRHCFNGLCRYNQSGGFNVSFGKYTAPMFPGEELKAFAAKLARAEVYCRGFEETFLNLPSNAVMYCDPPFVALSDTAYFTAYSADGFAPEQQQLLAALASNCPIPVLVSNHDTPVTRDLYRKATISAFDVQRNISQKGDSRGKAKELLALFPTVQSASTETIRQTIADHHQRLLTQQKQRKKPAKVKADEQQLDLLSGIDAEPNKSPEINHKWPEEVKQIVQNALRDNEVVPFVSYYNQLCATANSLLLSGNSSEQVYLKIKEETDPCAA